MVITKVVLDHLDNIDVFYVEELGRSKGTTGLETGYDDVIDLSSYVYC